MGRITNFFYGALIILVSLDAMLFGFIPENLIGIVVIVLGALVLFTPILTPGEAIRTRAPFKFIRRWIFGAYFVLSGLISMGQSFGLEFLEVYGAYASISSLSGQMIMILLGAIYFLAAFARTRNIDVRSF